MTYISMLAAGMLAEGIALPSGETMQRRLMLAEVVTPVAGAAVAHCYRLALSVPSEKPPRLLELVHMASWEALA